jgi:hypothetical protein
MMRSTFGAPLGGTMRGGHQAFDCMALSLMTPPNGGSGGGSCLPSIDVVAPGEPAGGVGCWAERLEAKTRIPGTRARHGRQRRMGPPSVDRGREV